MKTLSTVKNPLTVIAIFAGLAEVAGTAVLPFVAETNQLTYIWFLMIFPTTLVFLFFITLNWNPKVLYAPSDFKDESNYMEILRPSSTTERMEKIEAEIQESIDEEPGQEESTSDNKASVAIKPVMLSQLELFERMKKEPRSRYILAESLILDRLSDEFMVPAKRELALRGKVESGYLFDAVFEDKRGLIIVEIKFLSERILMRRLNETLHKIEKAILSMPDSTRHNARVLLAFAHEMPTGKVENIRMKIVQMANSVVVPVEIRIYHLEELIAETVKK